MIGGNFFVNFIFFCVAGGANAYHVVFLEQVQNVE